MMELAAARAAMEEQTAKREALRGGDQAGGGAQAAPGLYNKVPSSCWVKYFLYSVVSKYRTWRSSNLGRDM